MKNILIIVFCLILGQDMHAQQSLAEFRQQVEPHYHLLNREDVKNFSCLISSSDFISFIKERADTTYYYPLKFLWLEEGRAYYILQPMPETISDTLERRKVIDRIRKIKKLFHGVLLDWQKFSLVSPFSDIPDDAQMKIGSDTIGITFRVKDGEMEGSIKKVFTRSGELILDVWNSRNVTIVNYPQYEILEGRWICRGWDTQIYKDGEISSGLAIRLDLHHFQGHWMPIVIYILAQSQDKPQEKVTTSLYLKNYVFNENVQAITNPAAKSP